MLRRVLPGLVFALVVGAATAWAISTRVGVIVALVVAACLLPLLDRPADD